MDGVSLMVFDKYDNSFDIYFILEMRCLMILLFKKLGDKVYLEIDVLFKYVENILNKDKD